MSRVDYFRFGFTYQTSLPTSIETKDLLVDQFDFEVSTLPDEDGGIKRSSLMVKQGTMVIFEAWGKKADQFLRHSSWFAANAHLVSFLRLDIRQELADNDNFDLYRAAVNPRTRKNIQTFNSRERTKQDDRDAGGTGFALGSHKSDNRFIVYKRGKEQPAAELMLRTRQLDTIKAAVSGAAAGSDGGRHSFAAGLAAYDVLKVRLDAALETATKNIFGASLGEFVNGDLKLDSDRSRVLALDIQKKLELLATYGQQELFEAVLENEVE